MKNVIAEHWRRAVARDQRIGKQRHRAAAGIGDAVPDGEEITVVDRDGAGEGKALAVVVGQRHRVIDVERARALLLPRRVGAGHRGIGAGGGYPAEFGVIGVRRSRRREQHDRRRIRIDGFAVLRERQIVDAAALEIDRAAEPRRRNGDPRRCGDDGFTRGCLRRRCRTRRARNLRRRRRVGARPTRLRRLTRLRLTRLALRLLLLLERVLLALLFHLRIGDENLPADHHDERQHDGDNSVLVLTHLVLFRSFGRAVAAPRL